MFASFDFGTLLFGGILISTLLIWLHKKIKSAISEIDWHAKTQEYYDIRFPDKGIVVPHFTGTRLYMAKEVSLNERFMALPKKRSWIGKDLESLLDTKREARTTENGSYSVLFGHSIELDAKYLGQSVEKTDPEGTIGQTLAETLMHRDLVHFVTGQHLDVVGGTICSGSRLRVGSVPFVYWCGGVVEVDWNGVHDRDSGWGIRPAV